MEIRKLKIEKLWARIPTEQTSTFSYFQKTIFLKV